MGGLVPLLEEPHAARERARTREGSRVFMKSLHKGSAGGAGDSPS
jgi:hypothetical protein